MRYFIAFSYLGQAYCGWQRQPNAITVQEVLEAAFTTLTGTEKVLVAAGRTDAGVHAKQLYAHFNADDLGDIPKLLYRLNSFLPDDIAVASITEVPAEAHARFDATMRTYEYWITTAKNPFYTHLAHYIIHPLDIEKMNEAAALICSYSDFKCFSKTHTDVKTYLCDIEKAIWTKEGDKLVFTITANRFLRNMVRAIVGTLIEVGLGKRSLEDVKSILESRDRCNAGPSVPAKGLYLTHILYPPNIIKP